MQVHITKKTIKVAMKKKSDRALNFILFSPKNYFDVQS
jgi:hypothetical protein